MKSSNTNARTAVFGSTEFPWKWSLAELEKRPKHGHTVFSCFSCGGGSEKELTGTTEIDAEVFGDEEFKYECPNCGFRFN